MPSTSKNDGLVLVDYGRLKRYLLDLGLSEVEFADAVGISPRVLTRIRQGRGIRPSTLGVIADFLKLKPTDLLANGVLGTAANGGEWEAIESLGNVVRASNGLAFQIWRMRHRYLPDTVGRGKCYDLSELSTREEALTRERLVRHPKICRRFRGRSQIAINWGAYPDSSRNGWWIVDEHILGHSLSQALELGPLLESDLPRVMRQIAQGLLHGAVIIRRELSPRNVVIREADGCVVLTDFELGKLLDGSPTVSSSWPDDPYRAPEVGAAPQLDGRADLYSLGRIFLHAASGMLPAAGETIACPSVPPRVRDIVERCVNLVPDLRPKSIDEVLHALDDWQPTTTGSRSVDHE